MAKLAFTVAGGVVGSLFGFPQLGLVAGGLIGSFFQRQPGTKTYGPRLEDPGVSAGTYGAPIAYNLGMSHPIQCERFWVLGNERQAREKKESTGGKGGAPKQTFVTTEYFASFAVQIADAPISALRRLWLGRDLVYDGTSEALTEAIASGSELPLTGAIEGVTFRLYTGTADQEPDPLMQSDDPFVSAFRGWPYIVFEDLPLERWGNEIPPVFAEVTTVPPQFLDIGLPDYAVTWSDRSAMFDPGNGRLLQGVDSSIVEVYDVFRGIKERSDDFSAVPNLWFSDIYGDLADQHEFLNDTASSELNKTVPPVFSPDGTFYAMAFVSTGGIKFGSAEIVEAQTGIRIASLSNGTNGTFNAAYGFAHGPSDATHSEPTDHRIRQVDWLPLDPLTGVQPFLYIRAVRNKTIYYGPVSIADRGAVATNGAAYLADYDAGFPELFVDINKAGTHLYVAYRGASANRKVNRIPISGIVNAPEDYDDARFVPVDTPVTISAFSIGTLRDCIWSEQFQTFTVVGDNGTITYNADLSTVIGWTNQPIRSTGQRGPGVLPDGELWFVTDGSGSGSYADALYSVSLETGEVVEIRDLGDWGLTDANAFQSVWKLRNDIWLAHTVTSTGPDWTYTRQPVLLLGPRSAAGRITLASAIQDVSRRVGLAVSEIDVSEVSRQIYGCTYKSAGMDGRGVIDDLVVNTHHEAAMIDGVLKFFPRATSSEGTLDGEDLGADGGPILLRRTDSGEVVRRVEFSYVSVDAQMERAQLSDEFPVGVVPAGATVRLQSAIVMDNDEAWETTQKFLHFGSAERTEMEAAALFTRGDLEPGQIWTIDDDGELVDMRVGEIEGAGVLKLRGVAAWPFLTNSGKPFDYVLPAPVLGERPVSDFALIDSHMARDQDDSGQFYAAAWPRRDVGIWDGAVIYRSDDPVTFDDEFVSVTGKSTIGVATAALGDVHSANFWDRANSLNVRMIVGTPVSVTEAQALAGANALWIQCGATGEWELVKFATATEQADGTYTLTDLIRGARGTEHLTGSHAAGDRVIWASASTARRVGGSQIGSGFWYVSATIGASQQLSTRVAFTNRARGLRPLSVVQVKGARDGSDNLTVSWVRRSRQAGSPLYTLVPVAEESESYSIDVIDTSVSPEAIVRTLTSSSESVSYTAAQQTTDFGAPQASVTVDIYQISATFGRGVVRRATV